MRTKTSFRPGVSGTTRIMVGGLTVVSFLLISDGGADARGRGGGAPRSSGSVRQAPAPRPATRATPTPRPAAQPVAQPVRRDVNQEVRQDYRQDVRQDYGGDHVYGRTVRTLPANARRGTIRGRPYYYSGGAYYIYNDADDEYVSVETPVDGYVPELPDGCGSVVINEKEYYLCDGDYYQQVYYNDDVWYQRIDPP